MKQPRRWIFHALRAISLLLFMTTVALWIRSYTSPWTKLLASAAESPHGGFDTAPAWAWYIKSTHGLLDIRPAFSFYEWKTPYWKLVTIFLMIPLWSVIPWSYFNKRKRRIAHGLCPICGYDLRATPNLCPECGTPASHHATSPPAAHDR